MAYLVLGGVAGKSRPSHSLTSELDGELARLFQVARGGRDAAVARLCAQLYGDLHRIAQARLHAHRPMTLLDTTALAHESFLRLVKAGQVKVEDRYQFLGYPARVMRSVIVDSVRHRQAERRGGAHLHGTLDTGIAEAMSDAETDLLRINEALDELAQVDSRAVQVVEMRYFAGMTEKEIAQVLGVTERTIRRDRGKSRLLLRAALGGP